MALTDTPTRSRTLAERAVEVLSLMPAGEFTLQAFVTQAAPASVKDSGIEVWPMMKYLIDTHHIQRPAEPSAKQARWVRCGEAASPDGYSATSDDRLRAVLDELPCGPFTVADFMVHATGGGAAVDIDECRRAVRHLTDTHAVRQLEGIDMWVRC